MNTSLPISTISYNSRDFLTARLNEYRHAGVLTFWTFIQHLGEDDEAGKKEHFHIYAEPAKRFQTDSLDFTEPDPLNPDKPFRCISWRSSKFADWYLYTLHDKCYLAQKGLVKKYHYTHEQYISSDSEDLLFLARSIDRLSLSPWYMMLDALENGYTFAEFVRRGTIPIQLVKQYETGWNLLCMCGKFEEWQQSIPVAKEKEIV